MTTCPACGRTVAEGAFCGGCGAPLPPGAAQQGGRAARRGLLLAAVVALLALLAGGAVFAVVSNDKDAPTAAASASPSPSVEELAPEPEEPSPEPIEELSPEPVEEPTPEPLPCSDEQIEFTVVDKGFTFFTAYEQKQVSYGVVLKNPSTTCATSGVNVSLDFLNAAGDVVSTETIPLGTVPPGGLTALADTTFVEERPTTMEFGNQAATGEDPPTGGITVSNVRQVQGSIGTKFTGRLRSTLDDPVSARVAVVLRRGGKVIGGAFTYRDLPHNGAGGFEALTSSTLPQGTPTAYVTW